MDLPSIAEQTERPYVSRRHLPEYEMVQNPLSARTGASSRTPTITPPNLSGAGQGPGQFARLGRKKHATSWSPLATTVLTTS